MSTVTPLREWDIKRLVAGEIKACMARQGVTQAAVAAHLGISQSQFSKRLKGTITLDIEEVQKIADFLGVPLAALFGIASGGPTDGPGTSASLPRLDSNQQPFESLYAQVSALQKVA